MRASQPACSTWPESQVELQRGRTDDASLHRRRFVHQESASQYSRALRPANHVHGSTGLQHMAYLVQ